MLNLFPSTSKDAFLSTLEEARYQDRLEHLINFYLLLKKQESKLETLNDVYLCDYTNMDSRISKGSYFNFFGEADYSEMNCLERTCAMYFAAKEIYSESNPALVYLTLEDGYSVHATMLFTHNQELYATDPSFSYFGRVSLGENKLIVHAGAELNEKVDFNGLNIKVSDLRQEEREVKFSRISVLNDSHLEGLITQLRSKNGIFDFFYNSGQRAAHIADYFHPHNLFMYIDENAQNIVSEIRYDVIASDRKNVAMRIKTNIGSGEEEIDMVTYSTSFWRALNDEMPFDQDPTCDELFDDRHIKQFNEAKDYFRKTGFNWCDVPKPNDNLFGYLNQRKDMQEIGKLGDDYLHYYYGFVNGQDIEILPTEEELKAQGFFEKDNKKNSLEELGKQATLLGNIGMQEITERFRANLFRLSYDAKRYTQAIREQC